MTTLRPFEDGSFWSALTSEERRDLTALMRVRRVARDEVLVERGSWPETLFIVNFGSFDVRNAAAKVIDEIGAGQLIGEIGFFAGAPRTADVVAARDSEVLAIDRAEFDDFARRVPQIRQAATRALAQRLLRLTSIARYREYVPAAISPRMVGVVGAGQAEIPGDFLERLGRTISARPRCCFVTGKDVAAKFEGSSPDRLALSHWLSEIERCCDLVVCVADSDPGAWTEAVLQSADQVLLVAAGSPDALNPVESLALRILPKVRRRLIRVATRRSGSGAPSAPWLRLREAFMVHHVSIQDDDDFERLARFLTGRAVGFVASGGGAFGPVHVGIFKAFREAGFEFDIHGGCSVGAAMAAAFSFAIDPAEIKSAMQEMFVRRRALKRLTLPRFGLLDHKVFDDELRRRYPGDVEDAWKPYFAVATDLSTNELRVMREGPVWQAIRASSAIPGVLPPFVDEAGHLLVDGGVADNVPVATMHSLKAGPNLVVDLRPDELQLCDFDYDSIPGRRELLGRMINPWRGGGKFPACPGPAAVIQRSMFANIREHREHSHPLDLILHPPDFLGAGLMDWDRNGELMEAGYDWALRTIETLRSEGDARLAALRPESWTCL